MADSLTRCPRCKADLDDGTCWYCSHKSPSRRATEGYRRARYTGRTKARRVNPSRSRRPAADPKDIAAVLQLRETIAFLTPFSEVGP